MTHVGRRAFAGIVAVAAMAGGLTAQSISLSFPKPTFEAGEDAVLTVSGTPGSIAVLLVNSAPGPAFLPPVGDVGVAIDGNLIVAQLPPFPASGEWPLICNLQCGHPLLQNPCWVQAVELDGQTKAIVGLSNTEVLVTVPGDCGQCVEEAEVDTDVFGGGGGHAFYLPGVASDLTFISGGQLIERGDGTAMMKGVVASLSDPAKQFIVDVALAGGVAPGEPSHPPSGSPKLELLSDAYVSAGGDVDPRAWHYYTVFAGTLVGVEGADGALITFEPNGPAFQVGFGASGKNDTYGASGWLTYTVISEPTDCPTSWPTAATKGDMNLDLGGDCRDCVEPAGDHVLALGSIAKDMVFVEGGDFVELDDGTAVLSGLLADTTDAQRQFEVHVVFSDRINPGAIAFPPEGSPKKELSAGSYADNGGIVDPAKWHYYLTTTGTLFGRSALDGALVRLTRDGPAFQVGVGASGKSTDYGASGWLEVVVEEQPAFAPALSGGKGDFNIDLADDCP